MCPCAFSSRTGVLAVLAACSIAGLGALRAGVEPAAEAKRPAAPPAPAAPDAKPAEKPRSESAPASALAFTVKTIDNKEVDLAKEYGGKVVLIVNVASKCGFTGQYDGLEKLYKEKGGKGFVVLGFPANNFGGQEPGSNEEIAKFCQSKYNVSFPMFAKISVKGDDQHPLYKLLASQPAPVGGDPKWNFTKFLVDRAGKVVGRYDSSVRPNDKELLGKIDELLAAK